MGHKHQEKLQNKKALQRLKPLLELERDLHELIFNELLQGRDAALGSTFDVLKVVHRRLTEQVLKEALIVRPDAPLPADA